MISESEFEAFKCFIDECVVKEGIENATFTVFSPLIFVENSFSGDDIALKELLREKKDQLQERITRLGIHAVAHEYYVEAKLDQLWDVPRVSDEVFSWRLSGHVDEVIARAKDVGFEQAAEESRQSALRDLNRLFVANAEWSNLFGIPEGEL